MKGSLDNIATVIDRFTKATGTGIHRSAVPGLYLNRIPTTRIPQRTITDALLCLTAQGSEEIHVGRAPLVCGPSSYLLVAQNFPIVRQVHGTRDGHPYLGLTLLLDIPELTRLMQELNLPALKDGASGGVAAGKADPALLDAFERLVSLIETPEHIPVLASTISREIHYRLLIGEHGIYLRVLAAVNKRIQRVRDGMEWLRKNSDRDVSMQTLARHMGMSISTMHLWFRSVTSVTPLQFQKQIKLQKARALLLSESVDVSSVARKVGYKSASQFSSEYRRMFGLTPTQDMKQAYQSSRNVRLDS
jgi:AraC-like DNA-binding protein